MPAYVNIPDFIKIGLMAWLFIWLANKAMQKAGFQALTV